MMKPNSESSARTTSRVASILDKLQACAITLSRTTSEPDEYQYSPAVLFGRQQSRSGLRPTLFPPSSTQVLD